MNERNQQIIDHFNRTWPIGTRVDYRLDPAEPANVQRITRPAIEIRPGRLVTGITGHSEPVELRHLVRVDA